MLDTSRNIGIHIWSHALKPVLYEFQYGKFVSGFMAYMGAQQLSLASPKYLFVKYTFNSSFPFSKPLK